MHTSVAEEASMRLGGLKELHAAEGPVAHSAQKIFRRHFSVIRRGSRSIFVLCTASSDVRG